MYISPLQSGYQLIQQSNRLLEKAAQKINDQTLPMEKDELPPAGQNNQSSTLPQSIQQASEGKNTDNDLVKPLTDLQKASQYSKVGTNVVQREHEMIGSMLDTHV